MRRQSHHHGGSADHLLRSGRLAAVALLAWAGVTIALGSSASDVDDTWTVVLLAMSVALPIWCCFRRTDADWSSEVDLLQPGTVVACLFYFYVLIPAFHVWHDLAYQSDWMDRTWPAARLYHFTLVLCLLSLVAFRVGYRNSSRRYLNAPAPSSTSPPVPQWPRTGTAVALTMLAIGLPFRLHHLAAFGGPSRDVLLFLSPNYVAESGVEVGGVSTFFEGFFDWGALLLFLRGIMTYKHRALSFVVLGIAAVFAYLLSGKRSAILPFFVFPLTWIHYTRRRVTIKRGLVYLVAAFALVTLLLFVRTVGPILAVKRFALSDVPASIALQPARFYINSPELAVFDMTMLAVQDRSSLLHEIGGRFWGGLQYNFAPAAYIIPRFLWPGKPAFRDLGQVFFQHAVDISGRQDVGFTIGIVSGLYIFGGVIGVLVGMVVIGALLRLTHEWLKPWNRDLQRVVLYGIVLWMIFHFLRFGTIGYTLIYFSQFELPGVLASTFALRARAAPGEHGAPPTSLLQAIRPSQLT